MSDLSDGSAREADRHAAAADDDDETEEDPVPVRSDDAASGDDDGDVDDGTDLRTSTFRRIKRKTMRSLYGINVDDDDDPSSPHLFRDKSPKGSVDGPIRPLVDLINSHPDYATLSSCSGRIALFDPSGGGGRRGEEEEFVVEEERSASGGDGDVRVVRGGSGKGRGGWIFAVHGRIDASLLIDALNSPSPPSSDDRGSPAALAFKHEPLLLHVAASSSVSARRILSLALSCDFRESGSIYTEKRITVAIRGMGLALTVPLARAGPLRPCDEYLEGLTREANDRFDANERKLRELERAVERTLFERRQPRQRSRDNGGNEESEGNVRQGAGRKGIPLMVTAAFHPLPPLDLWGHAAVVVPASAASTDKEGTDDDDVDVVVIGGHGTGPRSEAADDDDGDDARSSRTEERRQRRCGRSDKVYCLSRRKGVWSSEWGQHRIADPTRNDDDESQERADEVFPEVSVRRSTFPPREGLAACVLPPLSAGSPHAAIAAFGGRGSPARPSDDLLLYRPTIAPDAFYTPTDVRGRRPSPRWGHAFSSLGAGTGDRLAVVVGGRDEASALTSIHVLSIVRNGEEDKETKRKKSHFLWERVDADTPVFHHCAVLLPPALSSSERDRNDDRSSRERRLLIFGGLSDPSDVLESFSATTEGVGGDEGAAPSKVGILTVRPDDGDDAPLAWDDDISSSSHRRRFSAVFGASCCAPPPFATSDGRPVVVTCGGVPSGCGPPDLPPVRCAAASEADDDGSLLLEPCDVSCAPSDDGRSNATIDVGPMAHGRALALPAPRSDEAKRGSAEVLLVGGGVASFAFGPTFAGCHRVVLRLSDEPDRPAAAAPQRNAAGKAVRGAPRAPARTSRTRNGAPRRSRGPTGSAKKKSTDVLFVAPRNAKTLKTALEGLSYLDKTYRMTKADVDVAIAAGAPPSNVPEGCIAVPVTNDCVASLSSSPPLDDADDEEGARAVDPPWKSLVIALGTQEVPYSSASLGNRKR